ncbi:HAD-IA family hydrolase [Calidifontibacter sp. DB0510]|uniref:HAD-IA family hydrolase n=1 Tax=Metallococcus carri TaxID=1656884 RepID=A0A967B9E3_9MICO|nr:HAD-IA family hydrolase [Metallococcus carri]NHN57266.1 HAD-IA family hydrolase [Metallococcus carri]NOP38129.1 HAD-IA family hydrolase [Calidifontibacter sp. DB2511S]
MSRVRALLWDADGVLQHNELDWQERLDFVGGEGFAEVLFVAELPALRGETSLRAALQQAVDGWDGPTPSVEELLTLWERTVVDADAMRIVDDTRARGILTCLATNQQDHRVAWMTERLGYLEHFDRTYWSSRMGVIKPEEEFFRFILDDLGIDASEVGFIDDLPVNVAAAQAVGIRAICHDPASGAAVLRREVAELFAD